MEIDELLGYEPGVEIAAKINEIIRYFKTTLEENDYRFLQIGDPCITLNFNRLPDHCLWIDRNDNKVLKEYYPKLASVYGNSYAPQDATDTNTYLYLPTCKAKVFWGGDTPGYIEAGLPDIKGEFTNTNIWAAKLVDPTGAFSSNRVQSSNKAGDGGTTTYVDREVFKASSSNSIYGNSTTVQPPAIKVRVYTRYE